MRRMSSVFLVAVMIATVFAAALQVNVIADPNPGTLNHYTDPNGSNTYPYDTWAKAAHSIQDAIDAAWDGDTVHVARGMYYEHLMVDKSLTLQCGGVEKKMPICTDSARQILPAIHGDRIVWVDGRNGNWDIYMYDLSTSTETQITTDPSWQTYPAIYGDRIVWHDRRNGNWDIYMYDLSTGSELQITTDTSDQWYSAIYGDKIVWYDGRNGNNDIYMYDLSTSTEMPICTNTSDQYSPAIYGDKIVWRDNRNDFGDIYMYDLTTSTETQITTNSSGQYNPDIYGDKIVWYDDRNGNEDIYMYDLSTGMESQITTNSSDQTLPAIYDDKIVWHDDRNGYSDIYMYDLSIGTETQITTNTLPQYNPDIYDDKIVWDDYRNGYPDIYMYYLSTGAENPICRNTSNQYWPYIYGDWIVWTDWRNDADGDWISDGGNDGINNADIYMYDLSTSMETPICTDSSGQYNPAIYDNKIVWEDDRNVDYDIYMYDLSTGTEIPICTNTSGQYGPAIYDDIIAWHDFRNGNWDIYMYDLSTGTETQITTNSAFQEYPAIYGDKIVWQDNRNGNWDVYMYDLSTGTETPICTDSAGQSSPAIYGEIIVWHDNRNGNWDIYMYDLSTGIETQVTTDTLSQSSPAIYGEIIVWHDWRNGNEDIYMYNLSTSTETPICTNPADQSEPAIYGDKIVWHDFRNGNWDIYMYDLSEDRTIIDGSGFGVIISVYADSVLITGFTVRNGYYGLYLSGSSLSVLGNEISNNVYGIFCDSSNPSITNNAISHNNYGISLYSSSPSIVGNTITYNTYGIKIDSNSLPTIIGNTISDNDYGIHNDPSSPVIKGNTITYNTYGIYCLYSNPDITDNIIAHNTYGIYCDHSSPLIDGNAITNNHHGIYCCNDSYPIITNNTFSDNVYDIYYIPKELKEDAITELKDLKIDGRCLDKTIDKAIKHIEKSLKDELWLDDTHLNPDLIKYKDDDDCYHGHWHRRHRCLYKGKRYGEIVFNEEKNAVEIMMWTSWWYKWEIAKLEKIIAWMEAKGWDTSRLEAKLAAMQTAVSTFEEVIDKLVTADKILAKTAINEAPDGFLKDRAQLEFQKALDDIEAGRPGCAIEHFKKAWKYAQDAIDFVPPFSVWITYPAPTDLLYEPSWDSAVVSEDTVSIKAVQLRGANKIETTLFEYSIDGTEWSVIGADDYGGFEGFFFDDVFEGGNRRIGDEGWSILWNIEDLSEGDYFIRATMTDITGVTSSCIRKIHIDRTPPRPEIYHPEYGEPVSSTVDFKALTPANDVVSMELLLFHGSPGWYNQTGLGSVNQRNVGPRGRHGPQFCTPAAVANALAGLKNNKIYPPGKAGDNLALAKELAKRKYLNTNQNTGTNSWKSTGGANNEMETENVGSGLKKYLEDRGVGCSNDTGYQVKTYTIKVNKTTNPPGFWQPVKGSNNITFEKYNNEIRKKQSVIFAINRVWTGGDRKYYTEDDVLGRGHMLTGRGADTRRNPDGSHNISYIDPRGGTVKTGKWETRNGLSYMNYTDSTGKVRVCLITGMWAVSPKETKKDTTDAGIDIDPDDGWAVTWDTTVVDDGFYTLIVEMTDANGFIGSDTIVVEVDNTAPIPEITYPPDGSIVSDVILIEAIETTDANDIVMCIFEYSIDGENWIEIGTDNDITGGWCIEWNTVEVPTGDYIVRATTIDRAGNEGYDEIMVYVQHT